MRARSIVAVIVVAFMSGAGLSWYLLRADIEATKGAVKLITGQMDAFLSANEAYRALSDLDSSVRAIGIIQAINNSGGPRKFIGEEHAALLKERVATMEAAMPKINEAASRHKAESLIRDTQKLLEEIEADYL